MARADKLDALMEAIVEEMGGHPRQGQIEMVHAVAEALETDGHLIVQAGTGTGKSIGYLAPAMAWAVTGGKRVVVSTATLALQRQIVTKDGPLVAAKVGEAFGTEPVVKVLKGWTNYVCLRKAMGGYPEDDALLSRAEGAYGATATGEEVVRAREWALGSHTGDRDDLEPGVDNRVWRQLSVSKPECIGDRCPHVKECFARIAREEAFAADIVVTNHAVLAIHASGIPILQEVDAIVVDEAHDLASRATSQLTASLSEGEVRGLVRTLRREGIACGRLEDAGEGLGGLLGMIEPGWLEPPLPARLHDLLVMLRGELQTAADSVNELKGSSEEEAASKSVARARVRTMVDTVDMLLSDKVHDGRLVASVSRGTGEMSYLSVAPLDVAGSLAGGLFGEKPAVLTSATLSVGGRFDHTARQVGFAFDEMGPWKGIDVASPFDAGSQGILYVASDLPSPTQPISRQALERIAELVEASRGGALCLFTSWNAAEQAAGHVAERVETPVLFQGDGHVPQLVEEFRRDPAASLFGTRTLWQGVDVPGMTNRLVIIDRIPFPVPDDPLVKARSAAATRRRQSAFMTVSVPEAALGLAQAAGRLLRATTDRGVVAILDSRLVTKRYGAQLLSALPPFWTTEDRDVACGALRRLSRDISV